MNYKDLTEIEGILETEKRLYRFPILQRRVRANKQELKELSNPDFDLSKLRHNSKSFVSLIRSGMRITPLEAHQAQIELITQRILADEHELRILKRALRLVHNDEYYLTIEYKYFRGISDDETSKKLNCSISTVRRNRSKLLKQLTVALYGAITLSGCA